jgi:ribosomal protein S4
MITKAPSKKSNRFRPLYKTLISLKENVQNRHKILKFKKKKWTKLINYYTNKFKKYKKTKQKDQNKYIISKFPSKNLSYKKRFKNVLQNAKKLNQYYGGLTKRKFKSIIKKSLIFNKHKKSQFLIFFEKRLDVVLYRSHFCESIRHAQQLILHSKIKVNNRMVNSKSYILKGGDLISIDLNNAFLVKKIIKYNKNQITKIVPKHLIINLKTLQIIFSEILNSQFASGAFLNFNSEIVFDYKKQ